MFQDILVVCIGNICRSPLAAELLQQSLPECNVSSGGLSPLLGHDTHPLTREVALAAGLELPPHMASPLTAARVMTADLILVMTANQRQVIAQRYPFALGKVFLLAANDVPDPYGQSRTVFEDVHQQVVQATSNWCLRLRNMR